MTDKYATKMMHRPFLGNLVSTHDQMFDCMSPTSTMDLKSKCESHNCVWRPYYVVSNRKCPQQEKYMQKTILPRSWQDYPTVRTQDMIPTNVGPPSPNSMPLALQEEVSLAKTKSHLPKGIG